MPGASRLLDIAIGICICSPHSPPPIGTVAIIITSSGNVLTNSRGTTRQYDIGLTPCGHIGVVITSSGNVLTNSRGTARCGDALIGCFNGIIVTCSGDTFAN